MCGFIGYISNKSDLKNQDYENKFNKYLIKLKNRGPDYTEKKKIFAFEKILNFGFSRLAIQDLSEKSNKIFSNNNKILLFNGEIYNFLELKRKYFYDHKFETNTDTELLFKLFDKFGPEKISECKGIFSIIFFDVNNSEIYLLRDPTGTKPLYYIKNNNFFAFSSEAWFLYSLSEKKININSLNFFLNFGFTSEGETLIKNVKKILPRNICKYNYFTGNFEINEYFKIAKSKHSILPDQNNLNLKIKNSVESNLISDAKVGTFLSGGVDSSTVTLLSKKYNNDIESFTTFYEPKKKYEKFNIDYEFAKRLSDENNIKLNTHVVENEKVLLDDFIKVTDYLDEPVSNLNFLHTYWQSKQAKERGIKVILTGDGADELFCGYERYYKIFLANKLKFFGNLFPKIKNYNNLNTNEIPLRFYSIFKENNTSEILKSKISGTNLLNLNYFDDVKFDNSVDFINFFDFKYWLTNESNYKLDKCSMINSVEARVPFQDIELIKSLFFIKNKLKFSFFNRKFLLKKNNFIPDFVKKRPKTGWFSPEKIFLDINLNSLRNIFFEESDINNQGIFNFTEVKKILDLYLDKGYLIKRQVLTLILFQIWYSKILKLD